MGHIDVWPNQANGSVKPDTCMPRCKQPCELDPLKRNACSHGMSFFYYLSALEGEFKVKNKTTGVPMSIGYDYVHDNANNGECVGYTSSTYVYKIEN